jgi:hypothetical protein
MIRLKESLRAVSVHASRLWCLACVASHRHGALMVALPLCSSISFFAFRIALSVLGWTA